MAVIAVTSPEITVAASGTEQRLVAAPVSGVLSVSVSAHDSNTGAIWVGDVSVAVGRGVEIPKGESREFTACGEMIDIYNMYVDAGTNGDKAAVMYFKKVT